MPRKLFELRVFRGTAEVAYASRLQYPLDFADPDAVADLLDRHLRAVAERYGLTREQAHLFHLEIRPVDRHGQADRDPLLYWALPLPPEDER